jgi:hypothetical protein
VGDGQAAGQGETLKNRIIYEMPISEITGLLPCAGSATRLKNLPKFMLPLKSSGTCLLTCWVEHLISMGCSKIIITCSPTTIVFVNSIVMPITDTKIIIKDVGVTNTMNDTIRKGLDTEVYDLVIMAMPDTFVDKINTTLIRRLMSDTTCMIGAYLWSIRRDQLGKIGQCKLENESITDIIDKDNDCQYDFGWGVIAFKKDFEVYLKPEHLHPGYSMKEALASNVRIPYEICNGQYFDCGTVEGYKTYLNFGDSSTPVYIKGTIIVLAVYINNDKHSYDTLTKCLHQLRSVYKYDTIVAVDNSSLNNAWYSVAKELDMYVLLNEDTIHRFEIGAYKRALQSFRADKYIFIQGTMFIKTRLNITLDSNKPDVQVFSYDGTRSWWDYWGEEYTLNLLKLAHIYCGPKDLGIVFWNCYCCNDLFVKEMFKSGIFNIPSNTKNHSCAFERILYVYIKRTFGKGYVIKTINNGEYQKIGLNQDPYGPNVQ